MKRRKPLLYFLIILSLSLSCFFALDYTYLITQNKYDFLKLEYYQSLRIRTAIIFLFVVNILIHIYIWFIRSFIPKRFQHGEEYFQ